MSEPTGEPSWLSHTMTGMLAAAAMGVAWLVDKLLSVRKQKLKDDLEIKRQQEEADEDVIHEAAVHEQELKRKQNSITITEYERFVDLRNKEDARKTAEYERIFSRQQEMIDKMQVSIARLNKQHNDCIADSIKLNAEVEVLRRELAAAVQEQTAVKKRLAEMEALVGKQVQLPAWPEPPASK